MFPISQYWMTYQPDLCSQALNIESIFGHSDISAVSILNDMSAWPYGVRHWILSPSSATLMFPLFQYWMTCQPDLCSQTLNIEWIFGHSDVTSVPILNDMSNPLNIGSIFGHSDVSAVLILNNMSAWLMQSSIEYVDPFRLPETIGITILTGG